MKLLDEAAQLARETAQLASGIALIALLAASEWLLSRKTEARCFDPELMAYLDPANRS